MKRKLFALALLLTTFGAYADCSQGKSTIFKCDTSKGKQIQVCGDAKSIEYSFGKLSEKPEIVLSVARSKVTTRQWDGMTSSEWYEIYIPNGNTVYSVYEAIHKTGGKTPSYESGVSVIVDGKSVATVKCAPNSKVVSEIQGIDLQQASNQ